MVPAKKTCDPPFHAPIFHHPHAPSHTFFSPSPPPPLGARSAYFLPNPRSHSFLFTIAAAPVHHVIPPPPLSTTATAPVHHLHASKPPTGVHHRLSTGVPPCRFTSRRDQHQAEQLPSPACCPVARLASPLGVQGPVVWSRRASRCDQHQVKQCHCRLVVSWSAWRPDVRRPLLVFEGSLFNHAVTGTRANNTILLFSASLIECFVSDQHQAEQQDPSSYANSSWPCFPHVGISPVECFVKESSKTLHFI
jgi:hypothetical protein